MIKTWYVTGDNHGYFGRYRNVENLNEETAFIILGDFGINFYLNKTDERAKRELMTNYPCYFYIVRGNHEARPETLPDIIKEYDENVKGEVYYEPKFPRLRYFMNYGIYDINNYHCLVIGGAYSVDKWFRLNRAGIYDKFDPRYFQPKRTGWFPDEQLTTGEMRDCERLIQEDNKAYDFVFTHTCPLSYEPTDLFLGMIDQSTVDNSMEIWMDELKDSFEWTIWCFGHFHADRLERPLVEQYYNDIENLNTIWQRWDNYSLTGELPEWWLTKSPYFHEIV